MKNNRKQAILTRAVALLAVLSLLFCLPSCEINIDLGFLTAGGEGSYWYDGSSEYHAGVFQVDAVDTTGAGDCFIGGLLYAYFDKGMDKENALRFANATAAVKCTIAGPRSRASVQDVLALME
jgi:sugar/nucleoside kinase (ribokinase family)